MSQPASSQLSDETEPLLRSRCSSHSISDADDASAHRSCPCRDDGSSTSATVVSPSQTGLLFKVPAAMFSFVVLGLFVATTGVLIPHLEAYYQLSDLGVSFVFLVWPVGYLAAAYLNGLIHLKLGQRGIAGIGPICHIVCTAVVALHPPFPVLVIAMVVGAVGSGLLDGSLCAWAGGLKMANTVQGLLHGPFSIGAAAAPVLMSTMFSAGYTPWYAWYYVLLAACVVEAVGLFSAFRLEDAARYREDKHDEISQDAAVDTAAMFKYRVTWVCAAYYLAYVGTEYSISGWIVVFMTRVRHASPYLASISSSFFWISMAVGRFALGYVTDKVGIRLANIIYLFAAITAGMLFSIIEVPIISSIMIAAVGFFFGPLFPSGLVMITRLLPKDLHVAGVSFVALVGQIGGALLPFGLGALAQALGIQVFQVVIFAQLIITLLLWISFPRLPLTTAPLEEQSEEAIN